MGSRGARQAETQIVRTRSRVPVVPPPPPTSTIAYSMSCDSVRGAYLDYRRWWSSTGAASRLDRASRLDSECGLKQASFGIRESSMMCFAAFGGPLA